jgi:hypothetical protein
MKNKGLLAVAVLLAAGAAIGLYGARSMLAPAPAAPGISSAPIVPPAPIPANLPPLEQSDELFRLRAGALSPDPMLAAWLKQESLIPRLAAAMNMIANGRFPREIFAAFAPRGKFKVIRKNGGVFIDPASFTRYDAFASMIDTVDAAAAAKVLKELGPLFDAALRGLGERRLTFHEAFPAAAGELLQTPSLEGDVALRQGKIGITWLYAEERFESRSLVQKQLIRMGPRNQAIVQAKLRALTLALGAPGL